MSNHSENDADLLGLPLRVVVSKRSLKNGGVELKRRREGSASIVPLTEVVEVIRDEVSRGIAERR